MVGRRNNANATAAIITKKAVIACSPTHPVPLVFALPLALVVSSSSATGVTYFVVDVVVFDRDVFKWRFCLSGDEALEDAAVDVMLLVVALVTFAEIGTIYVLQMATHMADNRQKNVNEYCILFSFLIRSAASFIC